MSKVDEYIELSKKSSHILSSNKKWEISIGMNLLIQVCIEGRRNEIAPEVYENFVIKFKNKEQVKDIINIIKEFCLEE